MNLNRLFVPAVGPIGVAVSFFVFLGCLSPAHALPPETYYAAHLNIIRLGREICQARKPNCEICPLQDLCDYFAEGKA